MSGLTSRGATTTSTRRTRWISACSLLAYPLEPTELTAISPSSFNRRHLFHWIWAPLVQQSLDEFREYWNYHHVRKQPAKEMASGHKAFEVYTHPKRFDVPQYLIRIPSAHVDDYREAHLPPRMPWYPAAFGVEVSAAFRTLGLSLEDITLFTSWDVFLKLKHELHRRRRFAE